MVIPSIRIAVCDMSTNKCDGYIQTNFRIFNIVFNTMFHILSDTPCTGKFLFIFIFVKYSYLHVQKLDISTARQRLKSPQSLSSTSTHPTMVTHRLRSWSTQINSNHFCSISISPSIPQIRLFQILTLKLQGQGHGCGQRARPYRQPSI